MFAQTALVAAVLFLLVSNHHHHLVRAQYLWHHQQYYDDPEYRRVFDTKALTPVRERSNREILKWAFAASVSSLDLPDSEIWPLKTMLVKLKENVPIDTRFDLEWIREYKVKNQEISLDVHDVVHELRGNKRQRYVLCGAIVSAGGSQGFIFRTKGNGEKPKGRRYEEVQVFTSITPWHNQTGYIAVGQTQSDDTVQGFPTGYDAVYVSVNRALRNPCGVRMLGLFPTENDQYVESRFHKVIPVRFSGDGLEGLFYATVGETTASSNDICRATSDVLVAVATEDCKVEWVHKYGRDREGNQNYNEIGYSIAQVTDEKSGLVIAGHTYSSINCNEYVRWDDILVFRIPEEGNSINWVGRYNLEDPPDLHDVGTAVQMSTDPELERTVLVGGEGTTMKFTTPDDNGSQVDYSLDAFLLELDKDTGAFERVDVFGLLDDAENGALFPGNLDLHLSRDHHAVILGNAELPNDNIISHPYLVERYAFPPDFCEDTRYTREKFTYQKFLVGEARSFGYPVESKNLKLEVINSKLEQEIVCDKTEFDVMPSF